MSNWNHAMCDNCWKKIHPVTHPVRVAKKFIRTKTCCFCGQLTQSGIFVRGDPTKTNCKGEHS